MYKAITISKEKIEKFIEEYTINKLSIKKIAQKYNSCENNIRKYLILNGCLKLKNSKFTDEQLQQLIQEYQNGSSLGQLAKKYKINRDTISFHFTLNGIEVINRQNMLRFDENVFDKIDTEEKAYWLGFIFADGCVYKNIKGKLRFELGLKSTDYNHLVKFAKCLKLDEKYIHKKTVHLNDKIFYSCRILLNNQHFTQKLIDYGCVLRKSLILKFPDENIFESKNLIRHFIRGYFDGDGCLSYRKIINTDKYKAFISMLGTEDMLRKIKEYISVDSIIIKDKRRNSNTFILNIHDKGNLDFLNYIYKNANVYLDRKFNRYLFFKDGCRSSKELEELLESEIGEDCDVNTEINQ